MVMSSFVGNDYFDQVGYFNSNGGFGVTHGGGL
jgi:hypothetical protein